MPPIVGQKINDTDGIVITRRGGSTWSLTPAEVIAHYQSITGPPPTRREDTFNWVKAQILANCPELEGHIIDVGFAWTGANTLNLLLFAEDSSY